MPRKKKEDKEVHKANTLAMIKIDALENKKNKTEADVKILKMLKEKHGVK